MDRDGRRISQVNSTTACQNGRQRIGPCDRIQSNSGFVLIGLNFLIPCAYESGYAFRLANCSIPASLASMRCWPPQCSVCTPTKAIRLVSRIDATRNSRSNENKLWRLALIVFRLSARIKREMDWVDGVRVAVRPGEPI